MPTWNASLDWAQICASQLPSPYCYYHVIYILSVTSPGSFVVDIGSEGTGDQEYWAFSDFKIDITTPETTENPTSIPTTPPSISQYPTDKSAHSNFFAAINSL